MRALVLLVSPELAVLLISLVSLLLLVSLLPQKYLTNLLREISLIIIDPENHYFNIDNH